VTSQEFVVVVANTFQIQPLHKGLAMQADVAFLCQEDSTDISDVTRIVFGTTICQSSFLLPPAHLTEQPSSRREHFSKQSNIFLLLKRTM
jgi:hypothetical protein